MRSIFRYGAGLFGVSVVGLLGLVQLRWDRTYEVPEPALVASTDPAVIARGRYLAYGPAHCAYCHTTLDQWPALDRGEEPPLSGGHVFELPIGKFHIPNLTPDPETGIGRRTDGELARMLRHGIRADGRAALPVMQFQNLSDEDVVALISFLRSQPPVRNEVPEHEIGLAGRAVFAFLVEPKGPPTTPPAVSPAEAPTVERGAYLANNVAECSFCHTNRSLIDGSETGPFLGGGFQVPSEADPSKVYVSPNLTPDPRTGHITGWSEEQFLARFRAGKLFEDTHMPWVAFGKMSDDDIRAIYRYLRTVEPVEHETGPLVQEKERK